MESLAHYTVRPSFEYLDPTGLPSYTHRCTFVR